MVLLVTTEMALSSLQHDGKSDSLHHVQNAISCCVPVTRPASFDRYWYFFKLIFHSFWLPSFQDAKIK